MNAFIEAQTQVGHRFRLRSLDAISTFIVFFINLILAGLSTFAPLIMNQKSQTYVTGMFALVA